MGGPRRTQAVFGYILVYWKEGRRDELMHVVEQLLEAGANTSYVCRRLQAQ